MITFRVKQTLGRIERIGPWQGLVNINSSNPNRSDRQILRLISQKSNADYIKANLKQTSVNIKLPAIITAKPFNTNRTVGRAFCNYRLNWKIRLKRAVWNWVVELISSNEVVEGADKIANLWFLLYQNEDKSPNFQTSGFLVKLTLRRPTGLPLTRSLCRKLRISADSSLIQRKIGTFLHEMMWLKAN